MHAHQRSAQVFSYIVSPKDGYVEGQKLHGYDSSDTL